MRERLRTGENNEGCVKRAEATGHRRSACLALLLLLEQLRIVLHERLFVRGQKLRLEFRALFRRECLQLRESQLLPLS